MNQSSDSLAPEGEWYFSRDGQQSGPLSYEELKAKADEGALLPRKDLVWKEGMTDWRPVGEIEGLFDRRPPPSPAETMPDPALEPGYEEETDGEWPGIGRGKYLFTIIILAPLLNFGVMAATPLLQSNVGADIAGYIGLGIGVLTTIIVINATLQRFSNLGMSRWWWFGQFVPLLNLWLGHRTIACPAGYAAHGKLDGIGWFLAIIYWLSILVSIAIAALFIAAMLGAVGDPEIQKQIREFIEEAQKAGTIPAK